MKKNSRIVIISMVLVFLLVFLISSTYAWFSANESVTSTDITLRVKTVQNLEVSTDARTWRNQVTLTDIVNAQYDVERHNQMPLTFKPVSTVGEVSDGFMNMYIGKMNIENNPVSLNYGKYVMSAIKTEDGDGDTGAYMSFDLYFKNTFDKVLYLGRDSYVKYTGSTNKGVENALRVGFVYEGVTSSVLPSDAQALNTNDSSNTVIWEPNYNKHSDEAISFASSIYKKNLSNDMPNYVTYKGVKADIVDPVVVTSEDPLYFGDIEKIVRTTSTFKEDTEDNVKLMDIPVGISKVRVYIWLEGQDVDCITDIADSKFELNINLSNSRNTLEAIGN